MIIRCKSGAQLVIGECLWVPGVYLSVGNVRGSQGAIVDPDAIDEAIAELTRIRALIAKGESAKENRRQRRAA
jgi:hypothetical protein